MQKYTDDCTLSNFIAIKCSSMNTKDSRDKDEAIENPSEWRKGGGRISNDRWYFRVS